jgi:hypothetical protein
MLGTVVLPRSSIVEIDSLITTSTDCQIIVGEHSVLKSFHYPPAQERSPNILGVDRFGSCEAGCLGG